MEKGKKGNESQENQLSETEFFTLFFAVFFFLSSFPFFPFPLFPPYTDLLQMAKQLPGSLSTEIRRTVTASGAASWRAVASAGWSPSSPAAAPENGSSDRPCRPTACLECSASTTTPADRPTND